MICCLLLSLLVILSADIVCRGDYGHLSEDDVPQPSLDQESHEFDGDQEPSVDRRGKSSKAQNKNTKSNSKSVDYNTKSKSGAKTSDNNIGNFLKNLVFGNQNKMRNTPVHRNSTMQ
ncbi:unnamed protein product [Trichobilharzia szidati]|nr:unnamed protein product [Trichobilharzia szidati]